jgi:hypothetical protein
MNASPRPAVFALPAMKDAHPGARNLLGLARLMGAEILGKEAGGLAAQVMPDAVFKEIAESCGVWPYGADEARREWALVHGRRLSRDSFLHVHDGERLVFPFKKQPDAALLASFHESPWALESRLGYRRQLARMRGALAASPRQADWLAHYLPEDRIEILPTPIETARFNPDEEQPRDPHRLVLLVTRGYDPALGEALVKLALRRYPHLQITVLLVGGEAVLANPAVTLFSDPTSSQRRTAYLSAYAAIAPLSEYVAEPALLEAMSCETPLAAVAVGDIGQHLRSAHAHLEARGRTVERCAQGLVEWLESVVETPREATRKARAARRFIHEKHEAADVAAHLLSRIQTLGG